jgi:iron-sulfur cluster assembly protein
MPAERRIFVRKTPLTTITMKGELPNKNIVLDAPVHISDRARLEIMDTLIANKIPGTYGLRVGLRGGACSATYLLGFDTETSFDQVYEVDGVRVIIDRRHLMYVLGANIDYEEGEHGQGFTINVPSNATTVIPDTNEL